MKLVSSASQVRSLDERAIREVGVPGIALMEVASRGVAEAVRTHHLEAARRGVVVVCGGGNNGGDGYGCARWLHGWGLPVRTVSAKAQSAGDAAVMRAACARLGIPDGDELGNPGLIVDAVLGTGVTRKVRGPARELIEALDAHPAPVVAVDIPSGIDSDTGQPRGAWVRAVRTVTFGRLKPGLLLAPGSDCAGVVELVDIGLDAVPGAAEAAVAEIPEAADLAPLWPSRTAGAHKGASGHLLVIAGSTAMAGAAVLAVRGALAAGVGLVTLLTARGALPRLGALPPEAMVRFGGDGDAIEGDPGVDLSRYDALLAGPGLGGGLPLGAGLRSWLTHLWGLDGRPMVYDADALVCASGGGGGPRVVTPHPGEAAAMLATATPAVQRDRLEAAVQLAAPGRVALLKGPNTLVAGGGRVSINPTGGPVLATGGSGDVLSGLVGALLARGCEARDAARLGAWVHGAAADQLASVRTDGWTASDVASAVPIAIAELLGAAR